MRTRPKKCIILLKEEMLEMFNEKAPEVLNYNLNFSGYPPKVKNTFLLRW